MEREAEQQALRVAAASAATGRGRLVVIRGRAGIGKSSLLAWAIDHCGLRSLEARASRFETEFTFGVVGQVLDTAAETTMPAAYRELAGIASEGPVLVAVDDAQWADRESLRFLHYLAERIDELAVLLVLTTDGDPAEANRDVALAIEAHHAGRVLELEPIHRAGIEALARDRFGRPPDAEFIDTLAELTSGVPFLLTEYITAADLSGIEPTAAATDELRGLAPRSASRAILARVAVLPEPARAVADAAAVLGDQISTESLRALTELDSVGIHEAAHRLVSAGVFRWDGPVAFAHPLVRPALYDNIAAARRDALHYAAARWLASEGARGQAATHLLRTVPRHEAWTVSVLWAAATECLESGDPDAAVGYLRRARDEPPPADVLADLLVDLGAAEALIGHPAAARHLSSAVPSLRSRRQRAATLLRLGTLQRQRGRYADAAAAFSQGLAQAPTDSDDLLLEMHAAVASVERLHRSSPAQGTAMEALQSRRLNPVDRGGKVALAELIVAQTLSGEPAHEVRALAGEIDDSELLAEVTRRAAPLHVVSTLGGALTWLDELGRAERLLTAGIEEARKQGSAMSLATASYRRAANRLARGDLAGALADAEVAISGADRGWELFLGPAHALTALVHIERDDVDAARRHVDDPPEQWEASSQFVQVLLAQSAVAFAAGDAGRARERAMAAGDAAEDAGITNPTVAPWRSTAAIATDLLGERAEAQRLVMEEVELARKIGSHRAIGVALRAAGVVAEPSDRMPLLEEAYEILSGSAAVLDRARAAFSLGRARRAGRAGGRALDLLHEARELAERCGSVVLADAAGRELISAGGRPRRAGRGSSLTASERRIAILARDGRTNREIAQELFVSAKAVEWHLGNVYRKLGISSRRDLGQVLPAGEQED